MEDQLSKLTEIKKIPEPKIKPPRKPVYFSLRWKLLVGFSLLFTLVFGIAFLWFYIFSRDTAMSRIQEDLKNTIIGAAEGVDGDMLTALVKDETGNDTGESDDPRYTALLSYLMEVHRVEPRAFLYVGVPSADPSKMIFAVDVSTIVQPDNAAPFLYEGTRSAAAQAALNEDRKRGIVSTSTPMSLAVGCLPIIQSKIKPVRSSVCWASTSKRVMLPLW
jgi:hypothetical protein